MSLFPTKTRLALLRAIDVGDVIHGGLFGETVSHDDWMLDADRDFRRVTSRMAEFQRANWAAVDGEGDWHLTDAGRAVLAQADAKERT